jgi:hypothetical protein
MYARLTIMSFKIDRIEEGIKIYQKSVIPAAKKQKGFMGAYLLIDQKAGKAISITHWRSEKLALANEENLYYQEQLVKFLDVMIPPVIKEAYDVRVKV